MASYEVSEPICSSLFCRSPSTRILNLPFEKPREYWYIALFYPFFPLDSTQPKLYTFQLLLLAVDLRTPGDPHPSCARQKRR